MVQPSHPYMTTGETIALTGWTFVGKVMSLLFNMLLRLVIAFFPRSKHLLISWLQSPSAVILEPKKIKSVTFHFFPICLPWSDGTGCHDLHFFRSYCRWHYFIPSSLNGWVAFPCVSIHTHHPFFILWSVDGRWGCFPILAVVKTATVNESSFSEVVLVFMTQWVLKRARRQIGQNCSNLKWHEGAG